MSRRHAHGLLAEHGRTGEPPAIRRPGRPPAPITEQEADLVARQHGAKHAGVRRAAKSPRAGHATSYGRVCKIMKDGGMVVPSPGKAKRRKWVRFERRYSSATWHAGWHEMKDSRFRGSNLVACLDDSSRCVTGAGMFREATSENAVAVLREAAKRFGAPAAMLSDNGSCFVGRRGRRKAREGSWQPTAFERELLERGIDLTNGRPLPPADQRQAGGVLRDPGDGDQAPREPAGIRRVLQRAEAPPLAGH